MVRTGAEQTASTVSKSSGSLDGFMTAAFIIPLNRCNMISDPTHLPFLSMKVNSNTSSSFVHYVQLYLSFLSHVRPVVLLLHTPAI
jgi:hypothetical protein